jgi:hypothetical protein
MSKILHKTICKKSPQFYSSRLQSGKSDEFLTDLVQSMKGYLDEAAKDTLHPRPQAILQLLKKAGI